MINHGIIVEDYIEYLCNQTFFSDFTVRGHKYIKPNGLEKEVADILVVYKDLLIAFQVKTKIVTKPGSEKTRIDFQRIENKIEETVKQFKTTKEAFDNDRINNLVSSRGLKLTYKKQDVKKIICIAVIDLIGEDEFEDDEKTGAFGGYGVRYGLPVHIFMRDQFEVIIRALDTLPDFLEYLNIRETLKTNACIPILTDELDLLATYKIQPDVLYQCIQTNNMKIVIDPGYWKEYESKYLEDQSKKLTVNLPDYFIDHVIDELHTTVDFDLPYKSLEGENVETIGTTENYRQIAYELALLNREERSILGRKFIEKMAKADKVGHGHTLSIVPELKTGILFFSSSEDRQERFNQFYQLCAGAYCLYNLKKLVGITTNSLSKRFRSYDFIFMDEVSFKNEDDLREWAKTVFKNKSNGK